MAVGPQLFLDLHQLFQFFSGPDSLAVPRVAPLDLQQVACSVALPAQDGFFAHHFGILLSLALVS